MSALARGEVTHSHWSNEDEEETALVAAEYQNHCSFFIAL